MGPMRSPRVLPPLDIARTPPAPTPVADEVPPEPEASATEAPGQGLSHLARARLVAETMPVRNNGSTENAEFEGAEWWEEHAELFAAARAEWGVLHPELFDLEADPGETTDVAALHPDVVARMTGLADDARRRLGDTLNGVEGVEVRRPRSIPVPPVPGGGA